MWELFRRSVAIKRKQKISGLISHYHFSSLLLDSSLFPSLSMGFFNFMSSSFFSFCLLSTSSILSTYCGFFPFLFFFMVHLFFYILLYSSLFFEFSSLFFYILYFIHSCFSFFHYCSSLLTIWRKEQLDKKLLNVDLGTLLCHFVLY